MNVLVLIATIPARRRSCERLLAELTQQTRPPDGVVLALDGYGDEPAPACKLPVVLERRTATLSGAGNRWRALSGLPLGDIVICLDDDTMLCEAPQLVQRLAEAVERGGAAAVMGRSADGKQAPPGLYSRGLLIYAAGCGVAARVSDLVLAPDLAAEVLAKNGPDSLGPGGDDDALVSAHLWKLGVSIQHVAAGNIFSAPGIVSTFKPRKDPNEQKVALSRLTGWPWPGDFAAGRLAR